MGVPSAPTCVWRITDFRHKISNSPHTGLIPQFLGEFMGYTAEVAGMAPGALVVMVMLPSMELFVPAESSRKVHDSVGLRAPIAGLHVDVQPPASEENTYIEAAMRFRRRQGASSPRGA